MKKAKEIATVIGVGILLLAFFWIGWGVLDYIGWGADNS